MDNDKIFISVASYRDKYLHYTVGSALSNATHPERLVFGICQQYGGGEDIRALQLEQEQNPKQWRVMQVQAGESLGVGWARNHIQKLYGGERYHLCVDSHSHFAPGWDVECIEQLETKPSSKPLLTTFSPSFTFQYGAARCDKRGVPLIKCTCIAPQGWIDLQMSRNYSKALNTRTYFLCANFIFTHGEWIDEIPQDPNIPYAGEEPSLALRSFTNGYDLFVPDAITVWHLDYAAYHDDGQWRPRPKYHERMTQWEHDQESDRSIAYQYELFYGNGFDGYGEYGLGLVRTRDEWERKAGIDLQNRIHCVDTDIDWWDGT